MLSHACVQEFETSWLPNLSPKGLDRLIELLETGSPLLIHGSFTRTLPMGCLATHAGWHHPATAHLNLDAGIMWLNRVAGLNPGTSTVVRAWDAGASCNWEVRGELLALLQQYRETQREAAVPAADEPAALRV